MTFEQALDEGMMRAYVPESYRRTLIGLINKDDPELGKNEVPPGLEESFIKDAQSKIGKCFWDLVKELTKN